MHEYQGMYEFNGWIRIAESPAEIDAGLLDQKCNDLSRFLSQFSWGSGKVELLTLNGSHTVQLIAVPNRRRQEAKDLNLIIDYIVENFSGAYGIIYEYDEGAPTANGHGVFSVKVIKRGRVEPRLDPFLSPLVPVCEDAAVDF